VYAHDWPSTYKDAPKAPGLVLSANVFGNASEICELILLLFGYDQIVVQQVVKIVLGTVGNILGSTADVLGVVDSSPARGGFSRRRTRCLPGRA